MKTATRTEFVCVKPRSSLAKDRFDNCMDRLHSCRVVKRKHGKVFLESISNRFPLRCLKDQMTIGKLYRE